MAGVIFARLRIDAEIGAKVGGADLRYEFLKGVCIRPLLAELTAAALRSPVDELMRSDGVIGFEGFKGARIR